MRKVRDVLDVHLRENRPGKPMQEETVRDFIRTYDKNLTPNASLGKLNRALKECGMLPIRFKPDRATVICILFLIIFVLGNTLLPFHRIVGIVFLMISGGGLLLILLLDGILE